MANTFTIRVAVNGSETFPAADGGDDLSWLTRVVNLRITGGGGSFYSTANPWTCSFDLVIPPADAAYPRTITVAVEGPLTVGGGYPAWATAVDAARCYRVVFHGNIVTCSGPLRDGLFTFNAVDEMATLFARRARLAASAGTHPRAVLAAIETAHSLSISGETSFPNNTTGVGYVIDRPAQKYTPNGDFIRTALAGTGINCHAEWNGPITAPELLWRPDWYWAADGTINTARRVVVPVQRAWLLGYPDVGYNFGDHYATVNVDGTDSGGTRRYGWARIHSGTQRLNLGQRELQLSSWLTTTTRCRVAAQHLLSRMAYPIQARPVTAEAWADTYTAGLAGWSSAAAREQAAWQLATVMLGDVFDFATTGEDLPSDQPGVTADVAAALDRWRDSEVGEPGWATTGAFTTWSVRTLTRTWQPGPGWQTEYGLHPNPSAGYTIDAGDSDSGTY